MNIGNLFKFKRSFFRDWVLNSATQKEAVMFVTKLFSDCFNLFAQPKCLFNNAW